MIQKARLTDLYHWLQDLPQPLIQEDPWLLLFKAQANRFIALDENIRILKEALVLFKYQKDRSGLLLGMGLLIEAEFVWGKHRPELIREAEELLNLPDHESCLYERAFLWRQIGWVHSIRGNPRRGYWACQQAYLLANQLGDPLSESRGFSPCHYLPVDSGRIQDSRASPPGIEFLLLAFSEYRNPLHPFHFKSNLSDFSRRSPNGPGAMRYYFRRNGKTGLVLSLPVCPSPQASCPGHIPRTTSRPMKSASNY